MKNKNQNQDSVPNCLGVVRYSLHRDRGRVVPQWHKRLYKFHRIRCTICFTSPKTKETTPAGKGHACCLLSLMSCCTSQAEAAAKQKVCGCSARLHSVEMLSTGFSRDRRNGEDLEKMVKNRKADCCTLLKRITNSKV